MTLDTCNFIAENIPIPTNFHKCYMFEYLPAFYSTCPRPFEPDLAMETPHGQAFFSGLKEDSFSKDDQRWVERPNKDMITKVGIDMKPSNQWIVWRRRWFEPI